MNAVLIITAVVMVIVWCVYASGRSRRRVLEQTQSAIRAGYTFKQIVKWASAVVDTQGHIDKMHLREALRGEREEPLLDGLCFIAELVSFFEADEGEG